MNKNFSKAEKSLIESDPKLGKVIQNNGHLQFSIKKIDPVSYTHLTLPTILLV